MHQTNPLVAKFLDDRESLSEQELGELETLLASSPELVVELKQQLFMDEILAQRLAVDRQHFTAQVAQRIRDLQRGDEEMHRQIEELRSLASKELTGRKGTSPVARLSVFAAAIAVAVVVAIGLSFWKPLVLPEMLAVVDDTVGEAQLIRDGKTQPVSTSAEVFVGDRFETSSQQALSVRYTDNTLVIVDGASSVEFGNQDETAGKRIFIHRGSLAATVTPQPSGRPLVIRTEAAEAEVLGTQFWLSRQRNQTRLDVLEGRVALSDLAGGIPQVIAAGQFGIVSDRGQLTAGNLLWPTTRSGLVFLFETQNRANLVHENSTGRLQSCRLSPRGAAHLNHHFALELHGGSFVAQGVADDLLAACRKSGEFTLVMTVKPAETSNPQDGVLATFIRGTDQFNFQLLQTEQQLQFQLRTRHAQQDKLSPMLTLGTLSAKEPTQIALVYQSGQLRCALNGEEIFTSDKIQGDLSNWVDGNLVFGTLLPNEKPWHGSQEGIALYSRALTNKELAQQNQAYQEVQQQRSQPNQLEIQATLLETSQEPTLNDMAPEEAALRVDKYRVDQILNGTLPAKEIYVARWAVLDGETQPSPALGSSLKLRLEPFDANPQLADFVCRDDFGQTAPESDRFYLVETP